MIDGYIFMTCFGCGRKMRADGKNRGKVTKCSNCGEYFKIFEDGMPERMVEVWFSHEKQFARSTIDRVVHFIDRANQSLDVAMYSLTHDWLLPTFEKAQKRGVAIRILTDRVQAGHKDSDDEAYAAMGISVARDVCSGSMHHKFAIRDRKCVLTGSYNWTKSAEGCNRENFLIVHYQHVVRQYAGEFERLWQRNACGVIAPEISSMESSGKSEAGAG